MTPQHLLLVELADAKKEIVTLRRKVRWLETSRDYWKTSARALRWGNNRKGTTRD